MNKMPAAKWRKVALAAGAGAVMGFAATFAFARLQDSGALGPLGVSAEIAALIGAVYAFTGLSLGVGVVSPGFGARFLNVEDRGELEEQRRMLSMSAVSMVAIGGALMLLALAEPAGIVPQTVALMGTAGLLALSVVLGVFQRRAIDEMMANLSRETAATAFYLTALVGGAWAILAHLGVAAAPAPLDWISMFAGLLLIAAFGVCGYRGLLRPR